jgi:hypothetical protein
LVLFGSTALPYVQSVKRVPKKIIQQVPLPGRNWSYRRYRGGLGLQFDIAGIVYVADTPTEDALEALADGTARILDLQDKLGVLESCLRSVSGPSWSDYTAESQSVLGTPFTLLGASTDYGYFGHREKCNNLTFTLAAIGTYGALTWEYSQGAGVWATLTIGADGTSGLHQNGAVTFTPPSDWKQDTVNSVANKFWVRVHPASVTTPATVNQIQLNNVFNCLMVDPTFDKLTAGAMETPYTVSFLQVENP